MERVNLDWILGSRKIVARDMRNRGMVQLTYFARATGSLAFFGATNVYSVSE